MTNITNESEWKAYAEEMTGGPGGCQIKNGGTCQRPDIRLAGSCDPCAFAEHCLVEGKLLLTKKQKRS